MAQNEFDDVKLTINIKNFPWRKRCPYCGEKPTEIEWSSEGLRIWCRNEACDGGHYHIFTPIHPEELDLVKVTKELLSDWENYCIGIKRMKKA